MVSVDKKIRWFISGYRSAAIQNRTCRHRDSRQRGQLQFECSFGRHQRFNQGDDRSSKNPYVLYVAFSNISNDPRVWRVTGLDSVTNKPLWKNISGDLPPGLPVNMMAVDPYRPDEVFLRAPILVCITASTVAKHGARITGFQMSQCMKSRCATIALCL